MIILYMKRPFAFVNCDSNTFDQVVMQNMELITVALISCQPSSDQTYKTTQ